MRVDGQIWAIPYSLLLGIHVSIIATDKPSGDERLEGYSQGQLVRTTEYEVKSTAYMTGEKALEAAPEFCGDWYPCTLSVVGMPSFGALGKLASCEKKSRHFTARQKKCP